MRVLRARNGHQALPATIELIKSEGIKRTSRDGDVLALRGPTTLVYNSPAERVVFWEERDANPFFHLAESIWMLAGRRDVAFVSQFVKTMKRFSDDGKNFHAAYGYRWRKHFGIDQINIIIEGLKKDKECRRQVLGMWDPREDLGGIGKDLPCNLNITFQINSENILDMVVFSRSGDAILGHLGANYVHMGILQEYVAQGVGVPIGKYWQISSNLHIYLRDLEKIEALINYAPDPYRTISHCPYENGEIKTTQVVDLPLKDWDQDLMMWMDDPFKIGLRSTFFKRVATPMFAAHKAYKGKDIVQALDIINNQMPAQCDWQKAAREWVERRMK